jgi:hypothetical protein
MLKYSKEEFLHIISGLNCGNFCVGIKTHGREFVLALIRNDKLENIIIPSFHLFSDNTIHTYNTSGHWRFSFISGEFVQSGKMGRCS